MNFRTLPIPPSLNNLYPGKSARYASKEYKLWMETVGWVFQGFRLKPVTGYYQLEIRLPVKMRGDVDNRIKAISDALVKARVTPDDSRMWRVVSERHRSVEDKTAQFRLVGIDPETGQPWD